MDLYGVDGNMFKPYLGRIWSRVKQGQATRLAVIAALISSAVVIKYFILMLNHCYNEVFDYFILIKYGAGIN